ncbi:DUF1028 domain-containing protein [Candidatus Bipolaricaulota bacterium]|nr:DUF1028 domain-containing protein [Candidatus Bipolaricaulota bacterium]
MQKPSTFSIVAHDPKTEELGIAVQSKFLAAGAVVPWAEAGIGAVATQSAANTAYGPDGLDLLRRGLEPEEVVEKLTEADEEREIRQVGIVDSNGNTSAFTGSECIEYAGHRSEENFTCQGNILVSEDTISSMVQKFRETKNSPLSERLVAALRAADEAGGDKRGKQSAALLVVEKEGGYGGFNDRKIDLRVDDNPEPIKKLRNLLALHQLYFGQPSDDDLVELEEGVIKNIQHLMGELGYYSGPVNGNYDEKTSGAFLEYCRTENFEEKLRDDGKLDYRIVEFMEDQVEKSSC